MSKHHAFPNLLNKNDTFPGSVPPDFEFPLHCGDQDRERYRDIYIYIMWHDTQHRGHKGGQD